MNKDSLSAAIVIMIILIVGSIYVYESINSDPVLEIGEVTDKYINRRTSENGSTSIDYIMVVLTKSRSFERSVYEHEFRSHKVGSKLVVRYNTGKRFGIVTGFAMSPYIGAEN